MYINRGLNGVIGQEYAGTEGRIGVTNPANMTRGTFVEMLYSRAGTPAVEELTERFTDAGRYVRAITWALEAGITNGVSAASFAPDAPLTRQEMAVFIYRYLGSPDISDILLPDIYDDYGAVASWAVDAMWFCVGSGYMQISEPFFNPGGRVSFADGISAIDLIGR
jgi:hypothetical protein